METGGSLRETGDHTLELPRSQANRLAEEISIDFIARMNRDYIAAKFKNRKSEANG